MLPYCMGKSKIHHKGVIATHPIKTGDVIHILPLILQNYGGFNHSCDPNMVAHTSGDAYELLVIRDIKIGEELTVGYSQPIYALFHCNCEIHRGEV